MAEKRERFIPIGLKLIGIISLLLVAALVTMTLLATFFFTREIERTVKLNTLERSELIAQKLETQLGALRDRAKLFASSLEGGISFGGTGTKLSSLFFEQDPGLLAVCIVRRTSGAGTGTGKAGGGKGFTVVKYASSEERLSVIGADPRAAASWIGGMGDRLETAFSGSTVVANVSPEFKSPVLAFALPYVMRTTSQADSVVVAFESLDQIEATLASRELYTNMLTGPKGDLLAHPDTSLVLAATSLRDSPIVKDSLTSSVDPKQMGYRENGKRYLGSYKKILSGGLTVFSIVDENAALAAVYQIQRRNIFIVLIVLAVALILALFFSRTLTTPIKRLVAATTKIREGDYAVRIDVANPRRARPPHGGLPRDGLGTGRARADQDGLREVRQQGGGRARGARGGLPGRRNQGSDHLLLGHPLLHRDFGAPRAE